MYVCPFIRPDLVQFIFKYSNENNGVGDHAEIPAINSLKVMMLLTFEVVPTVRPPNVWPRKAVS